MTRGTLNTFEKGNWKKTEQFEGVRVCLRALRTDGDG